VVTAEKIVKYWNNVDYLVLFLSKEEKKWIRSGISNSEKQIGNIPLIKMSLWKTMLLCSLLQRNFTVNKSVEISNKFHMQLFSKKNYF